MLFSTGNLFYKKIYISLHRTPKEYISIGNLKSKELNTAYNDKKSIHTTLARITGSGNRSIGRLSVLAIHWLFKW